jgi:HD-GYP domain-containing protein (c-di-GMP phosphodiesterase class II)
MGESQENAELISGKMQELRAKAVKAKDARLSFLDKLWSNLRLENKEDRLLSDIMQLTCNAMNASAASLLLYSDDNEELLFNRGITSGINQFKRLSTELQSDVARWVTQNGKPMTVNDADRSHLLNESLDMTTGFKTNSIIGAPLKVDGKVSGVIEVYNKLDDTGFTQQDRQILTGLAATSAMALENARTNTHVINSYRKTVNALVSLADAKETSGGGHSRRVAKYALLGASGMNFDGKTKLNIEYAAILHDIGKLSIPDNVLNKAESLTDEEWELIYKHPQVGYDLLKDIPLLKEASKLVLYHHERYDGKGYPNKIKGKDIPMEARLISVADAFDNMTTEHSYRKALNGNQAFAELTWFAGTQFCPTAVQAFKDGFLKSRPKRK